MDIIVLDALDERYQTINAVYDAWIEKLRPYAFGNRSVQTLLFDLWFAKQSLRWAYEMLKGGK